MQNVQPYACLHYISFIVVPFGSDTLSPLFEGFLETISQYLC
jgi:hypothetical protein